MTRKAIANEIGKFLRSPEPEILCIQGLWGTGKTYAWNLHFKEAIDGQSVALKRYAYCSLFGVNSLAEFKQAIVENTIKGDNLADPPTPTTFIESAKEGASRYFERGLRNSQSVAKVGLEVIGLKSAADLIGPSLFLTVRNQIVCVDDIERKGNQLAVGDVLGLLSILKEQRKCKAVIILNELELDDSDDFRAYLEKVVDVFLTFQPSAKECADTVFVKNDRVDALLHRYCTTLELTNIRVLKRIKKLAQSLAPLFADKDPRVLDEALKSVALLSWVIFSKSDAPTVDFIRGRSQRRVDAAVNKESLGLNEREKHWSRLLDGIGSSTLTPLDETLLKDIQNGYFDEATIVGLAAQYEKQLHESDLQSVFFRSWEPFHNGFDDNEEEVISVMISAVRDATEFVSPSNFDSCITLLRRLDQETEADELIAYYMEHHGGDASFFTLRAEHPFERVSDEKLRLAFANKARSFVDDRSIVDFLVAVATGQTTIFDRERLKNLSAEEFRDAFKQLHGDDLRRATEYLFGVMDTALNGSKVAENARSGLKLIGMQTKLNRIRVENKLNRL